MEKHEAAAGMTGVGWYFSASHYLTAVLIVWAALLWIIVQ